MRTENRTEKISLKSLKKGIFMTSLTGVLLAGMLLAGCVQSGPRLKEYSKQYLDYFDTFSSITIYAEDEEQFQQYEAIVREKMERYHQLFDIYEMYEGVANFAMINACAGTEPVEAEPEILELLNRSVKFYELTNGKVNPALGSVLQIWHDYRTEGLGAPNRAAIPELKELQEAADHTDIHRVEIDEENQTVYLPDPVMQLDVGAVAKGYAAHEICEELREAGVTSALINLGGNVQTIGTKADGKPWRVGVQNPDTASKTAYLHVVKLQDMALVTSGSYQRFYEVDGVRYHHIIDPDTLMPNNTFAGVTVLCKDGMMADALSTAVFNMELEEGQKLIESLESTEAIWIYPDGKEVYSSGFETFVDD